MSIYLTLVALVFAAAVIIADLMPDPRGLVPAWEDPDELDRRERAP